MHAIWMWCIARIMPLAPQPWARAAHCSASSCMLAPAPPSSLGTAADRSLSRRIASNVSLGNRALASTSAACLAATSRATTRVRATRSLLLP